VHSLDPVHSVIVPAGHMVHEASPEDPAKEDEPFGQSEHEVLLTSYFPALH